MILMNIPFRYYIKYLSIILPLLLMPSWVNTHPITNNIYVRSAVGTQRRRRSCYWSLLGPWLLIPSWCRARCNQRCCCRGRGSHCMDVSILRVRTKAPEKGNNHPMASSSLAAASLMTWLTTLEKGSIARAMYLIYIMIYSMQEWLCCAFFPYTCS